MPDTAPLSRRERRKLEVRSRIVDAAVGLFDERGFAATTVAEICEQADVAHKTFFNHFPTKQHLLREIAGQALDWFLADLEEARKLPGDTAARLGFLFGRIAERAEEAGPMRRELLTEVIHVAHEAGTGTEQTRKLHDAFGALVKDGLAAGDVTRAYAAETLVEMVLGGFYGLMFNWTSIDGYPLGERAEAAGRFLGDALARKEDRA